MRISMLNLLKKNWWLLFARGIFALTFGLAILALDPFFPIPLVREATFASLALLFGFSALICGLLTIFASIRSLTAAPWPLFVDGIAISMAGLLVVLLPELTLREVLYMIALAALMAGVSESVLAAALRHQLKHKWLLMTAGVGSAVFGVYLALSAEQDLATLLRATCAYALVSGLAMAVFAVRLRTVTLRGAAAAA